jgi:hypothetical protein
VPQVGNGKSFPSSLTADGRGKSHGYTVKEIKSDGRLNEDGGGFDATGKIGRVIEFGASVVPLSMKFTAVMKLPDIT